MDERVGGLCSISTRAEGRDDGGQNGRAGVLERAERGRKQADDDVATQGVSWVHMEEYFRHKGRHPHKPPKFLRDACLSTSILSEAELEPSPSRCECLA